MSRNTIIFVVIAISLVAITIYSLQDSQGGEQYIEEIKKFREEKDLSMTRDDFPFAGRADEFTGLKYFEPDPAFRISASLTPIKDKNVVLLATNDGLESKYLEYAHADFSISGVKCRLLILEIMEQGPNRGTLFLAFADETSTHETYGAGRYLDLRKVPGSSSILLDFNKAYNPYCAYSDKFSCPFPPRENILHVAIRAGEKNYK